MPPGFSMRKLAPSHVSSVPQFFIMWTSRIMRTISTVPSRSTFGTYPAGVADLNGDGIADLAATDTAAANLRVFYGTAGTFPTVPAVTLSATSVASFEVW